MPFRFHSQVLATGSKVYIFTSIIISVFLSLSMWDYDSGKCRQKQIMFIFIILTRVVYNIHVLLHSIAASNLKCIFIFSWNGIIAFRIIQLIFYLWYTTQMFKWKSMDWIFFNVKITRSTYHIAICVYISHFQQHLIWNIQLKIFYYIRFACVCWIKPNGKIH